MGGCVREVSVDVGRGSGRWEVASRSGVDFGGLLPVRDDYATVPIRDGFDWAGSVGAVEGFRAYLVVFRSVRKATADVERLIAHDDRAHEEARGCAGFMHYFKGDVGRDRYCLSFCLWESREYAKAAARGMHHQLAVAITEEMYDAYELERYELRRDGDSLIFESASPGIRASQTLTLTPPPSSCRGRR